MTSIRALPMTFITKPFHLIATAVYRIAYKLHHKIFLRSQPPIQAPVIIVGSYLAGGAGKTPFTIWLARYIQEQGKHIAILCHKAAWDEFIMMQREFQSTKFPQIEIFTTKNRYATAREIQDKFDIILCDDGFEDSRFTGAHSICLDWHEPPATWAKLWPAGPFRSLRQDHNESTIVHLDCRGISNGQSATTPDIHFSIESITNFAPGTKLTATVICGLGNPQRFIENVRSFGVTVENSIIRPDHDKRFLQTVQAELSHNRNVVISQKDACRLPPELLLNANLHTAIQKVTVSKTAVAKIASAIKG